MHQVVNLGQIFCMGCGRELIPQGEWKQGATHVILLHPQNRIGTVKYGYEKCELEEKTVRMPFQFIDVEIVK